MDGRQFSRMMWALLVAFGVVLPVAYYSWLMPLEVGDMDPQLFERGIGSPLLAWLNGYLGVLFNYRYLGATNWLVLIPIGMVLATWRRRAPWQRGLVVFYTAALALIGAMGGFNYRYALTLQPLTIAATCVFVWLTFERKGRSARERGAFVTVMALLGVLNSAASIHYHFRVASVMAAPPPEARPGATLAERLDAGPEDLERWLNDHGVRPTDTVLVNNLPVWYYRTRRPGIYFWCGSDQLFLRDGTHALLAGRTVPGAASLLRDSLHCRYIFSTGELSALSPPFTRFLAEACEPVATDPKGHTLHRVKDTLRR